MPIEAAWTSTCQNRPVVAQIGAATLVMSLRVLTLGNAEKQLQPQKHNPEQKSNFHSHLGKRILLVKGDSFTTWIWDPQGYEVSRKEVYIPPPPPAARGSEGQSNVTSNLIFPSWEIPSLSYSQGLHSMRRVPGRSQKPESPGLSPKAPWGQEPPE